MATWLRFYGRRGRLLRWLAIVLLAVIVVIYRIGCRPPTPEGPRSRWAVVRVLDGDTVELPGGERLRLRSIDTPEKDEPFYEEATALLDSLVAGRTLRVAMHPPRRDKYGRLLGYAYVDDTLLVERVLVSRGLAYVYLFEDTDSDRPEVQLLLAAQREAIDARRGLHGLERAPETHYLARPGSFRFHRPMCGTLDGADTALMIHLDSREDALRLGLSPCRRCKP